VDFDPSAWSEVLGIGGGWLCAVLLGGLVIYAFAKGWIVTGKSLDREIDRSKVMNETNENLMKTVSTYAKSVSEMIDVNRQSAKVITALQELPPAAAKETDVV
jgi:hypothetical protein